MASKPTKEQKLLIKERANMEGLFDKELLDNLISCFKKEESHGLSLMMILKANTALLEEIAQKFTGASAPDQAQLIFRKEAKYRKESEHPTAWGAAPCHNYVQ